MACLPGHPHPSGNPRTVRSCRLPATPALCELLARKIMLAVSNMLAFLLETPTPERKLTSHTGARWSRALVASAALKDQGDRGGSWAAQRRTVECHQRAEMVCRHRGRLLKTPQRSSSRLLRPHSWMSLVGLGRPSSLHRSLSQQTCEQGSRPQRTP